MSSATKTQITWKSWLAAFRTDLAKAAAAAGIDITEMKTESATLDQTWGDRVGLAFFGAGVDILERAATFFAAWAQKHLHPLGNYNAQFSGNQTARMHRSHYSNGAKNWCHGWEPTPAPAYAAAIGLEIVSTDQAIVVSYVYYPCAD